MAKNGEPKEPGAAKHSGHEAKMNRRIVVASMLVALPMAAMAQVASPVPRPFPGAPTPPATAPRTQMPEAPAAPAATTPATPVTPGVDVGTVPVYPTAEYLDSFDAGSGQRYHLFGTDLPFAEIVAYYRTVLKNGGREIYRTPAIHQFDLGRFDENRMAFPPSVVVKDYAAAGPASGYLHAAGTVEKRYRTIIQIVPPPAAP
jgi:hypothetical protein